MMKFMFIDQYHMLLYEILENKNIILFHIPVLSHIVPLSLNW